MVNIAGKRSSFGYLNAQLNAIPGVLDGAFFLREGLNGSTGVERLAAVVVAPGLSVAELTEQLRQRIDPVFLPRPLLMVDAAAAQCDRETAAASTARSRRQFARGVMSGMQYSLEISADHPAFAGHFPNFPVLPGAVLLDEALKVDRAGVWNRSDAVAYLVR